MKIIAIIQGSEQYTNPATKLMYKLVVFNTVCVASLEIRYTFNDNDNNDRCTSTKYKIAVVSPTAVL